MKRSAFLLYMTFFVFVSAGHAQTNTASIAGAVTDAQGAAVPGAFVTATENATGVKFPGKANSDGYYSLTNLPIGGYSVEVEAPGFERYVRNGITLTTSQSLELNIPLTVGVVSQSVEVTSASPLVEARTSGVNQLIESKSVSDLPLGNRRTMNIVQTLGAAVFQSDAPNAQPVYSLAGGRLQSQMTYLDGALSQNLRLGAGQQSIDPPVDTIQEIEVMSTNYPAQYGAVAGGVVIETTKSGTNSLHGSLYEFLRNDAADAPGYFAPVLPSGQKLKPELRYSVFGGTLGGAIKHDKTFFFVGYEGQRRNSGSTTTLTVPTVAERSGNFSALLGTTPLGVNPCDGSKIYAGQIFDPSTTRTVGKSTCRTSFPGNKIPTTSLDTVGANVVPYYPLPNSAGNAAGANNFSGNAVSFLTGDFVIGKVDDVLTSKDHLTGRYMFYRSDTTDSTVYPLSGGGDPINFLYPHTNLWYASWTRVISSNKVNNLGFAFYQRVANQFTPTFNKNYPQKIGLTGVPQTAFPQFVVAGFSNLGSGSQGASTFGQVSLAGPLRQFQYLDDFSWSVGRHDIKFGGEVRTARFVNLNQPNASGAFTFPTQPTGLPGYTTTGNGLASLQVGFPTAFLLTAQELVDRRSTYLAGYIQDDWAAIPRLTLNVGLRYEVDTPMYDANNRLNGFDSTQINPVSGTAGVVKFAGVNGYPIHAWGNDLNNFAPRIGFALKPFNTESTVVRGGFGVYFGPPLDNTTQSLAALGFTLQAALNSPDNGITAPFYLRNGVPVSPVPPVLNDSFGAVPVGTSPNTAVSYFDRNRKNEYSYQFNLTVEHQFGSSTVVQLSGIGNLGRKMSGLPENINQISPSILGPLHQSQADLPFPQFSQVTIISPTNGILTYEALVARLERRFSRGFNLVSTYTQSKWLGDTNDFWSDPAPYSNYYNRRADYGPVENDIEKRFTFNAVYELPFGPGREWLNKGVLGAVIGGWSVGNITTVQSGGAFTPTTNTNNTNAFSSGPQRPNVAGNANLSRGQRSISRWFATNLFSQPATYTFGNAGRGSLRTPGYVDLDFSLLRTIQIEGRLNLQLRADAFNALNHTNLGSPGAVFGTPNFAVVGSIRSDSQRELDVSARLAF